MQPGNFFPVVCFLHLIAQKVIVQQLFCAEPNIIIFHR